MPSSALALEIGSSNLGSAAQKTQVCANPSASCLGTQEMIDGDDSVNVVPAGYRELTGFAFQSSTDVALVILRQTGPSSFSRVTVTPSYNGLGDNTPGYVTFPGGIRVQPGDFIGVRYGPGDHLAALSGTAGQTRAWEMSDLSSPTILNIDDEMELLLSASVEPDDDNDGLGDDTQDPDGGIGSGGGGGGDDDFSFDPGSGDTTQATPAPSDPLAPLRAGKRPRARILGKRYKVSKKWTVKIRIANPNRFRIRGRLRLRRKRLKVGSKRVRVAPNKRKRIRFKIRGRTRRLLYRKRRLKVKAVLKVRGPIGKSRTVRKTLVLRAPKRPRPRRPRNGGGGGGGGNLPGTNLCGSPVYVPGSFNYDGTYTPGRFNYCPGLYPSSAPAR